MRTVVSVVAVGTMFSVLCPSWLAAQDAPKGPTLLPPQIAYVHPAGAKRGSTVNVVLAGIQWTPDMQYFVLEDGVEIDIVGALGPLIVPEPPYWFGFKGRNGGSFAIPREVRARLTVSTHRRPGPVRWQVANANGSSKTGFFYVSDTPEVIEERYRRGPQELPELPVTVSGQVLKIEEVDFYRFRTAAAGPVTCEIFARRLGSLFSAALQVTDAAGKVVADVADTEGDDLAVTFTGRAGDEYVVRLHDLDFGGNRALTYRLKISQGPRIVASLPARGQRGVTREVTFVGYGLRSGRPRLETLARTLSFPDDPALSFFDYQIETLAGEATWSFPLSNLPETTEGEAERLTEAVGSTAELPRLLTAGAITGTLGADEIDRYRFDGKKGESWSVRLARAGKHNPLDLVVVLSGADGKQLAKNDDLEGTTDAGLTFSPPNDGLFGLEVHDVSGRPRSDATLYRLELTRQAPDFKITIPDRLSVEMGGKVGMPVKAERLGSFSGPIQLSVDGLLPGITIAGPLPKSLLLPEKEKQTTIYVHAAEDASSRAGFLTVNATAQIAGRESAREVGRVLLSPLMKSLAKVTPVDREGGRTVHAGTTYPAMVVIDRFQGYEGEVVIEMSGRQGRHRQGIDGTTMVVKPGVTHVPFLCYMPEWLQSNRTSRMACNALVHVADAHGNKRWLVTVMDGRITMSLEGALMNIDNGVHELLAKPGATIEVPIRLERSPKLPESAKVELQVPPLLKGLLSAESITLGVDQSETIFRVATVADHRLLGVQEFVLKATALEKGQYPAIAHTTVKVEFVSEAP